MTALKKTEEEIKTDDDEHPTWAVMADSGFQGLETRIELPFKRYQQMLTAEQLIHNSKLSSARVICENFYSRLLLKWTIMAEKFKYDKSIYGLVFLCCVCLTNYDVLLRPLRAERDAV